VAATAEDDNRRERLDSMLENGAKSVLEKLEKCIIRGGGRKRRF
jgi:hypothetical protein